MSGYGAPERQNLRPNKSAEHDDSVASVRSSSALPRTRVREAVASFSRQQPQTTKAVSARPERIPEDRKRRFEPNEGSPSSARLNPLPKGSSLLPERKRPWELAEGETAPAPPRGFRKRNLPTSREGLNKVDESKKDVVQQDQSSDGLKWSATMVPDPLEKQPQSKHEENNLPTPEPSLVDKTEWPRTGELSLTPTVNTFADPFADLGPDRLPAHLTPFEYALQPFLQLRPDLQDFFIPTSLVRPSTTEATPSSTATSSNLSRINSMAPTPSLPPVTRTHKSLLDAVRITRINALLARCSVLSQTTLLLEQRPWRTRSEYRRWTTVLFLARQALDLVGQLGGSAGFADNDGLKARCWYWIGRAHGGEKDWDEAAQGLERAILWGEGGLMPAEKESVRLLSRSAMRRGEEADREREEGRRWENGEWERGRDRGFERKRAPWDPYLECARAEWRNERRKRETGYEVVESLESGEDSEMDGEDGEPWLCPPRSKDELRYIEVVGGVRYPLQELDLEDFEEEEDDEKGDEAWTSAVGP